MSKVSRLGLFLLIAGVLVGCGFAGRLSPQPTPEPAQESAEAPAATSAPLPPQEASPTQESAPAPVSGPGALDELYDVAWQWTELHEIAPASPSVVADPENSTARFGSDGTVGLKADCNSGSGSYQSDGSRLAFGPMAITVALCVPGSLSDQLLKLGGDAVSAVGGGLCLQEDRHLATEPAGARLGLKRAQLAAKARAAWLSHDWDVRTARELELTRAGEHILCAPVLPKVLTGLPGLV